MNAKRALPNYHARIKKLKMSIPDRKKMGTHAEILGRLDKFFLLKVPVLALRKAYG